MWLKISSSQCHHLSILTIVVFLRIIAFYRFYCVHTWWRFLMGVTYLRLKMHNMIYLMLHHFILVNIILYFFSLRISRFTPWAFYDLTTTAQILRTSSSYTGKLATLLQLSDDFCYSETLTFLFSFLCSIFMLSQFKGLCLDTHFWAMVSMFNIQVHNLPLLLK